MARAVLDEAPDRYDGQAGGAVVSRGLGVLSLGLGAALTAAPREVARTVGLPDDAAREAVLRVIGVREIVAGLGLLADGSAGWVRSRVAGDTMDLAVLGWHLADSATPERDRDRLRSTTAAIAGIWVLDALAARWVAHRRRPRAGASGRLQASAAVTVRMPVGQVYRFWRDLENLPQFMTHLHAVEVHDSRRSTWHAAAPGGGTVDWTAEIVEDRAADVIAWRSEEGADVATEGRVTFRPAPRDRGTEIRVRLAYDPPAGRLGAAVARLLGESPQQQLDADLRRLKQVLETGAVVRSDAMPDGVTSLPLLRQRPAQPVR